MSPILAKRYLVEDFTDTFDLIGDRLSKSLIQKILSEYEEIGADDPDNFPVSFDCESLLTLLGEHEKAIRCLDQIQCDYGKGMRMLRYASHYAGLNDIEGVKKSLHPLLTNPTDEHEKECAFIAAGRIGDRDLAVRLWEELIREKGLGNQRITNEVIGSPDAFNCLSHLQFREWYEGIHLLYRYDIKENRDIELCALVSLLHYQIGIIYNTIIDMIQNTGPYESFTGLVVAIAVSSGTHSWITEFRDIATIDEPKVYHELILNLEGVRKYLAFFTIGERLLTMSTSGSKPDKSSIYKLLRDTGGDIYQVFTLLELFTRVADDADYVHLLDIVLQMEPDIARKTVIRKEMEGFLGPQPPFDYV